MSPAPCPAQVSHPILSLAISVLRDLLAQEHFSWERGANVFAVPRNFQPGKLPTPLLAFPCVCPSFSILSIFQVIFVWNQPLACPSGLSHPCPALLVPRTEIS